MESPDGSERKWACVAISNLIQNDPSTRRLLQGKNVVGALITRLSDSEEEVWIEAAGALRSVRLGLFVRSLILHTLEIFVLMEDMTFARRCTIKTSFPHSGRLCQRCVRVGTQDIRIIGLDGFSHKISTILVQFLESPRNAPENAKKVVYEFADNVITILWCLS